jgi:hypothetical protein
MHRNLILRVILYRYQNWFFTLREGYKLRVSERESSLRNIMTSKKGMGGNFQRGVPKDWVGRDIDDFGEEKSRKATIGRL